MENFYVEIYTEITEKSLWQKCRVKFLCDINLS